MYKDVVNRLKEAKEYQSMAMKSLLPEQTVVHINAIEKELGKLVKECVFDVIKKEASKENTAKKEEGNKPIKKINIG